MSLQKRMAAKLDDADFDDFVTEVIDTVLFILFFTFHFQPCEGFIFGVILSSHAADLSLGMSSF